MFDSTPDIDFIIKDSGVLVARGQRDEESGYGIVDDYDETVLDIDIGEFTGNLVKVTTKTSAFSQIVVGDQLSFNGGVYGVVKTAITNDGELCESFVVYQEPAIVTEAQVRAIIASMTPAVISVNPGDGLQAVHDSLPASGGTIAIGDATYYANPLNPSTPLVITKPIEIFGMGGSISGIGSPILNASSSVGFSKLFMRPPGAAYAMRIYNGGTFTPRCWFNHVFVGASFNGAGDGPVDGIQLDAAGVLLAEQLTVAFCTGQGLLVDSTGAEGNTTLKFDMCSFVQNALYGVKITTSCTVAEFNGGNMESNGSIVLGVPVGGEFYAENCGVVAILGVDFERDPTDVAINNIVEFENVNSVRIIGNNFLKGSAVHGFLMAGCASGRYEENRFEGWGAAGVCRVAETSQNISQGVNHLVNVGSWIEDYSR